MVVSLFLVLGLCELALRYVIKPRSVLIDRLQRGQVTTDPDLVWDRHEQLGWIVRPNSDFWFESPFREFRARVVTDGDGFRVRDGNSAARVPGGTVLFVGDSVTAAYEVRVEFEKPYLFTLARIVFERYAGRTPDIAAIQARFPYPEIKYARSSEGSLYPLAEARWEEGSYTMRVLETLLRAMRDDARQQGVRFFLAYPLAMSRQYAAVVDGMAARLGLRRDLQIRWALFGVRAPGAGGDHRRGLAPGVA